MYVPPLQYIQGLVIIAAVPICAGVMKPGVLGSKTAGDYLKLFLFSIFILINGSHLTWFESSNITTLFNIAFLYVY